MLPIHMDSILLESVLLLVKADKKPFEIFPSKGNIKELKLQFTPIRSHSSKFRDRCLPFSVRCHSYHTSD